MNVSAQCTCGLRVMVSKVSKGRQSGRRVGGEWVKGGELLQGFGRRGQLRFGGPICVIAHQ